MDNKDISRRDFIQRLSLFGVAGVGAASLLSACGGGEQQPATPAPAAPQAAAEEEGFTCMDTSGLTEMEVNMRNQLQYTDTSPEEGKTCSNCALYQPPATADGQCGTCTVVKGPIHPDGYCTSWALKPA